ncbi:uncharacterized protein [Mobula birostris]|uniref:uncharacterized protein isoform X2 n=1 Tax=Mobula birostris TaxID=1983395 RepID=UPI003B28DB60
MGIRCNVQCYGRGEIHKKIVKELDISHCEEPEVPCVLFVYKVSHEILDIKNAFHWVTGGGLVQKEDICAVILLQKSTAVREEKITKNSGLFHEGTKVFRVFWMDSSSWWSRSKTYQCPTVIQTVKQSLIDRTRPRGGSCSGRGDNAPDDETSVVNELLDCSIPSGWSQRKRGRNSEKCNGSSKDPKGTETSSLSSEQTDNLTSSTDTHEKIEKNAEQLQCNGSSKDPKGTETSSLSSEQTDNLTSSTDTH